MSDTAGLRCLDALSSLRDGVAQVPVGPEVTIGTAVNGGLTLALAARSLAQLLEADGHHAEPLVVSGYFLSATSPGELDLRPQVVRAGRTMATGQVSATQQADGECNERVRALATFGDLGGADEDVVTRLAPPPMPDPDDCLDAAKDTPPGFPLTAWNSCWDLRFDPATTG